MWSLLKNLGIFRYEVTVFSHPAPCTPANVMYQYSCGTGIASVSWNQTLGRNSFYVRALSGNQSISCSTSQGNNCSLPVLLCSRTYNIEVVAMADNCSSSAPAVTQIQTGKSWKVNRSCLRGDVSVVQSVCASKYVCICEVYQYFLSLEKHIVLLC